MLPKNCSTSPSGRFLLLLVALLTMGKQSQYPVLPTTEFHNLGRLRFVHNIKTPVYCVRDESQTKNVTKSGKVQIFLENPPDNLDFFEFGKK